MDHTAGYADLLARRDAPAGSSWGLFSRDPERGMANLAGPAQVLDALACVRRGATFNLDYPLDAFHPPINPSRRVPRHEIVSRHHYARDDVLHDLFLQGSSQIDGLRHRGVSGHGFYNGVPAEEVTAGTPALGVHHWAEKPIVGRGLLLDLDRLLRERGTAGHRGASAPDRAAAPPLDHATGPPLRHALLDEALAAQGCAVRPGDILLVHTGWAQWFLDLPASRRRDVVTAGRTTGFAQSRALLSWLWDHAVAVFATDTYAVEVVPPAPESPFRDSAPEDGGLMHQELIGKLGLPLGELWNLAPLARDSAVSGQWDCLVTIKPLNLVGGVGSPPNALAIR